MRKRVKAVWLAALAGTAFVPGVAWAQIADPKPGQGAPVDKPKTVEPAQETPPIVSDKDFDAAIPKLSDDINAPLEPIEGFTPAPTQGQQAAEVKADVQESFADAPAEDPEFLAPLPALADFKVEPPVEIKATDSKTVTIRYKTVLEGLKEIGLDDRFKALSALEQGDGKAANSAMVAARAREDEKLAVRLMQSLGYYDGTAISTVEQIPKNSGNVQASVIVSPGALYRLGTVKIVADPTVPAGLLERELNLNPGDPIEADRIQGAEANVSLRLPQQGYPFAKLGQRDILLDDETQTGDYTLPVTLGPRAVFGDVVTQGRRQALSAEHINILRRYKTGAIYDVRATDDLRDALIATSLFSTVSVEPVRTGEPGPDGTEVVNILVRQAAGPVRTLAGEAGYSTGQGIRLEGSWTHRNLFPEEGALIISGVAGTQEQGASATFRRSNAGQRDRTFELKASLNHSDYDAYESYTGTLSARISRESTPIWQKRWTYYYGAEITGSNEDRYNFNRNVRDRGTYLIAALPGYVGYDRSDNLLNPTRGYRIKFTGSPEASVRGAARPYARLMLEGTYYQPFGDSIVVAARARVGSIPGIARDDLAPSRRYYAGGGGSVRGFGYQELGPRSPDGRPVGGRAFNEFALEARYRFGDLGVVPFVDAGQVYEDIYPTGQRMRFGAGIGGRLYTNFGPIRIDVATPINRQRGESKVSLYISIGQAF